MDWDGWHSSCSDGICVLTAVFVAFGLVFLVQRCVVRFAGVLI